MGLFSSSSSKRNGKAARLRKMLSRIKKLEKKKNLDKDLKAAAAKLKSLSK